MHACERTVNCVLCVCEPGLSCMHMKTPWPLLSHTPYWPRRPRPRTWAAARGWFHWFLCSSSPPWSSCSSGPPPHLYPETSWSLRRSWCLCETPTDMFCSQRMHLFDQKYSKNCEILLLLEIAVFNMNICSLISAIKAVFSASLLHSLQCHMIFRNHSNILICCSRNISDYYQCWKQLCCPIFLWKPCNILFFRIHRWIESSKEQHLF